MVRRRIVVALVLMMLLTISFGAVIEAKTPAEKKGEPEIYDKDGELDSLEDLFLLRHLKDVEYNFTVPDYLKNKTFGSMRYWDKEYQGYSIGLPKYLEKSWNQSLPPDYKYANVNMTSCNGNTIYSINNTRSGMGGVGAHGIKINDSKCIILKAHGACSFYLFKDKKWDNLTKKPQNIEFRGECRGYLLYGLGSYIKGFDQEKQYVKVNLETNRPVRAYIFDADEKMLIDYNEERTNEKELKVLDPENPLGVGDIPTIAFATFGDKVRNVSITLSIEIKDIPNNIDLILYGSIGGIITVTGVVLIWARYRRKH